MAPPGWVEECLSGPVDGHAVPNRAKTSQSKGILKGYGQVQWSETRYAADGLVYLGQSRVPVVARPFAPGQHGQSMRKKSSVYGQQLLDKQKIRCITGCSNGRCGAPSRAQRMGGVTGTNLLMLLETRLDCTVPPWLCEYDSGARQLVGHGHIRVDGRRWTSRRSR